MYLAPQNIPRAISVLALGSKVILYRIVLFCLKIKNALHRLSDLESEVAANDVLSRRVVDNIKTNDLIIDGQQADDREQFAKLTKIQTFLEEV